MLQCNAHGLDRRRGVRRSPGDSGHAIGNLQPPDPLTDFLSGAHDHSGAREAEALREELAPFIAVEHLGPPSTLSRADAVRHWRDPRNGYNRHEEARLHGQERARSGASAPT